MIVIPDRLALRRTRPADLLVLDEIEQRHDDDDVGPDLRGLTPAESARRRWHPAVWQQYVAFRLPDFDPICTVSLYDADLWHGTAWLLLVASHRHRRDGLAVLAAAAFLSVMFRETALRRVHAEVSDETLASFRSLVDDGTATISATVPDCLVGADGGRSSLHWLTIEREQWETTWGRVFAPHLHDAPEGRLRASSTGITTTEEVHLP